MIWADFLNQMNVTSFRIQWKKFLGNNVDRDCLRTRKPRNYLDSREKKMWEIIKLGTSKFVLRHVVRVGGGKSRSIKFEWLQDKLLVDQSLESWGSAPLRDKYLLLYNYNFLLQNSQDNQRMNATSLIGKMGHLQSREQIDRRFAPFCWEGDIGLESSPPQLVYYNSPGWWWMISVEHSVEWLAAETEALGENLIQCRFVHHKSHMIWSSFEPRQPWLEPATSPPSYRTASLLSLLSDLQHLCNASEENLLVT
jgi:hypothetical protein